MRSFWNSLSDPGLHMLAIALVLVYLAFGASRWDDAVGVAPLPYCKACRFHYLPDKPCACRVGPGLAHASP